MQRHAIRSGLLALLLLSGLATAAEQSTLFGYYLSSMGNTSMEPSVRKGDRVWSDPGYYRKHALARGDVVAFRNTATRQQLWIKRVIGLPGENVVVRAGVVHAGGKALREDYVRPANNRRSVTFADVDVQLGPGEVFLMGDNRDASYDGRFAGPVRVSEIEAKVVGIYLSATPSQIGRLDPPAYP